MLVSLLVSVWLSFVCDTPHKLYFQQSRRSRLTTHRFYWGQRHPIPRKAGGAFYPMDVLSPKKCDDRGFPLFSLPEEDMIQWKWKFSTSDLDLFQWKELGCHGRLEIFPLIGWDPLDIPWIFLQGEMSHIFQGEKPCIYRSWKKIHNKLLSPSWPLVLWASDKIAIWRAWMSKIQTFSWVAWQGLAGNSWRNLAWVWCSEPVWSKEKRN